MDRTAKKLLVAVTMELMGKGAGLVTKGKEGGLNVLVLKGFKTEHPVVACGAVDKNERKIETTDGDAVPNAILTWTMLRYFSESRSIALPRGAFGIVAYVQRDRGNSPVLRRTLSFVLEMLC